MAGVELNHVRLLNRMSFFSERRRLEWYLPFWLMRVKVIRLAEDWREVRLRLPLNWWSANAAGNMFGGYQASLADPVPALACLNRFPGYRVATRHMEVAFDRVGNSDLELHFDFPPHLQRKIETELREEGRSTPSFEMKYIRQDGKVCTIIRNTVAIRPAGYIGPREEEGSGN